MFLLIRAPELIGGIIDRIIGDFIPRCRITRVGKSLLADTRYYNEVERAFISFSRIQSQSQFFLEVTGMGRAQHMDTSLPSKFFNHGSRICTAI